MTTAHVTACGASADSVLTLLIARVDDLRCQCGAELEGVSTPALSQLCLAMRVAVRSLIGRGAPRGVTLHAHTLADGSTSVVLSITAATTRGAP